MMALNQSPATPDPACVGPVLPDAEHKGKRFPATIQSLCSLYDIIYCIYMTKCLTSLFLSIPGAGGA